jgi:hypothetical protein
MEKKRNAGMFQPGKSGNPSGKGKLKPLTDRIRMTLAQNPDRAQNIAEALIKEAEAGNLQATAMILDRLEGRPTQSLEITDARQVTEIAEIDKRIDELSNRLRLAPLIDASAEDVEVDDETTRH